MKMTKMGEEFELVCPPCNKNNIVSENVCAAFSYINRLETLKSHSPFFVKSRIEFKQVDNVEKLLKKLINKVTKQLVQIEVYRGLFNEKQLTFKKLDEAKKTVDNTLLNLNIIAKNFDLFASCGETYHNSIIDLMKNRKKIIEVNLLADDMKRYCIYNIEKKQGNDILIDNCKNILNNINMFKMLKLFEYDNKIEDYKIFNELTEHFEQQNYSNADIKNIDMKIYKLQQLDM